ncbi:hypothetical protein HUJ05_006451 [Dendroctonus ponderosae]|nr:hypothetical protein HUJ05_006451 [Dendroctonus ponderosae]
MFCPIAGETSHCVARALYDNTPDTADELAFQKGDTLVVLEQNTANLEGWWLCSLRGRQNVKDILITIPTLSLILQAINPEDARQ